MRHLPDIAKDTGAAQQGVLMRSPVREETLVPIHSFRLDECEALEAKLRQSCQGQATNRLSIFAE
jgi:hypothetical protein